MAGNTAANAGPGDLTGKERTFLDSLHELLQSNGYHSADPERRLEAAVSSTYIRELIRQRRGREVIAPATLFSDPAWDILLDLTAARMEGQSVSISSACVAANVPATTALRWINLLVDKGLLVRKPERLDGRRATVTTTDGAQDMMTNHLGHSARKLAMLFVSESA